MSEYCKHAEREDQSSSSSMSGAVGFLCMGGTVSRSNADWSGDEANSANAAGSCFFTGDANHGTLTINGCQIVGYIGEMLPASPQHDGTKETDTKKPVTPLQRQPTARQNRPRRRSNQINRTQSMDTTAASPTRRPTEGFFGQAVRSSSRDQN
jgi:hypothetical protein